MGCGVGVSVAREVAVGLGNSVPVITCVGAGVAVALGVDVAPVVAVGDGVIGVAVDSEDTSTACVYFVPRFKSSRYSTVIVCEPGAFDK